MPDKIPLRIRERIAAIGGSYDYVKTDPVPDGEIWIITSLAYENETGARGTFRRYIEGHGYNHYIAEKQSPAAAELIFTNDVLHLLPGERLTIRQASCTASDILSLYAMGYKIFSKYLPNEEV